MCVCVCVCVREREVLISTVHVCVREVLISGVHVCVCLSVWRERFGLWSHCECVCQCVERNLVMLCVRVCVDRERF